MSQQNVKLDLVIYNDNREIADIFDPKASDYDLVFKDVMIHPYLTLKKRVFFPLLHGQSRVEMYFNNSDVAIIPYSDYNDGNHTDENVAKHLVFINSDDIILLTHLNSLVKIKEFFPCHPTPALTATVL